jgi:hypothetical protein
MVLSCPVLSVAAGHRIAPYGPCPSLSSARARVDEALPGRERGARRVGVRAQDPQPHRGAALVGSLLAPALARSAVREVGADHVGEGRPVRVNHLGRET